MIILAAKPIAYIAILVNILRRPTMKLELKEINKSFGAKQVLQEVSFSAESGRALGLLGRNGAGKTTTIRIIMDVFKANDGEIFLNSTPIKQNSLRIGYLPEERGLYPKRKIIDQLIYFAQLKGMNKKEALTSVNYWLERLEMTEYGNKPLETLSKGNQQKIQLITAIASNPEIVILDEPFSGLDPVNALLLESVVKELISTGKIVIFSSHQMNYIQEFCDDIAILNSGKIVLHGSLQAIINSYPRNKLLVKSSQIAKIKREIPIPCEEAREGLIIFLESPSSKSTVMEDLSKKYDLDSISVLEPSLNDIFVEYTSGIRDGTITHDAANVQGVSIVNDKPLIGKSTTTGGKAITGNDTITKEDIKKEGTANE